jgi:hypothetical protein
VAGLADLVEIDGVNVAQQVELLLDDVIATLHSNRRPRVRI